MAVEITESMAAPIFVYYQLENFYQNHRRYVKSRDYEQLMGWDGVDESESSYNKNYTDVESSCEPILQNKDLANMGITTYYWKAGEDFGYNEGELLVEEQVATPCGLIAKSMFNDTFALYTSDAIDPLTLKLDQANRVEINEEGIAWQSDISYKFNNTYNWKNEKTQWMDMENEHFIVWMRTAGLPNFRKLWGKIENELAPLTYYVDISNNYNVKDFSGTKSFVLSTTNMLGGRNYFLAVCYIVVGALCIVFAVIFFVAYMRKRNISNNP